LVLRKWYDEIELYFGPVGHTHNGNDAVHYIHNQIAGNYCSITPAELFNNYRFAWLTERTRPQPIIVETQYDWKRRFAPLKNDLKGFTNTKNDKDYARCIRFTWTIDGVVEATFKGSPLHKEWFGDKSIPGGPGLVCLRGAPTSMPRTKEPKKTSVEPEYLKRLQGVTVRDYCCNNVRMEMYEHLIHMAAHYEIKSMGPVSPQQEAESIFSTRKARSGYGIVERIGHMGCQYFDVPFIRNRPQILNEQMFWELPRDIAPDAPTGPLGAPIGSVGAPRVAPFDTHVPAPTPFITYKKPQTSGKRKQGQSSSISLSQSSTSSSPKKTKPSKSKKVVSSDEDLGTEQLEDSSENSDEDDLPKVWPGSLQILHVGDICVQQVMYDQRRKKIGGIALCEVPFFSRSSDQLPHMNFLGY
jgi:hypothetical protein